MQAEKQGWDLLKIDYSYLKKHRSELILILSTLLCSFFSFYSIQAGYPLMYQNLFYFPIILACILYLWRGFLFTCGICLVYLLLMSEEILTNANLMQVLITIGFFLAAAGMVTLLVSAGKGYEKAVLIQHNLSLSLSRCTSMSEALDNILAAALKTEGVDSGGIYVEDPGTGAFDIVTHYGLSPEFIAHSSHYKADSPHIQRSKAGIPFFGCYSDFQPAGRDSFRDQEHIRSLVSIPILHEGELVAILNMASHTVHTIPEQSRTILETMAMQTGSFLVSIRSREVLEDSQARFRAMFDSAFQFIALLQPDGTILEVNETALDFLGLIRADIINRPFQEIQILISSSDTPARLQEVIERAAAGEFVRYEVEEVRVPGGDRYITVDFTIKPIQDTNGRVTSLLAEGRDISEQKRGEKALRDSEQKYRSVIENIQDIYYRTDNQGIILMISPSATRILGYASQEEMVGRPIEYFWAEPDERKEKLRRIRDAGRIVDYEVMIRKKDGTLLPVSITSTYYRDPDGSIQGIEGIIRDITERKKAHDELVRKNEELREAYEKISATEEEVRSKLDKQIEQDLQIRKTNAYLESLISIANVPIIIWDPMFRIIRLNHACELLIGRPAEEVIGNSLEFLFPPENVERSMRLFKTTLEGVRWETVEIDIQHHNGTKRTVLWNSATLYDEDGGTPLATIAQGRDITEQKKLELEKESALVQIQKNLAQLAILNDGIRNPLSVIAIYTDMLDDNTTNSQILSQIHAQIEQIDEMVTQLDQRWEESEKVLSIIRKHYQIIIDPLLHKDTSARDDTDDTIVSPVPTSSSDEKSGIFIEEIQAQLFTILDSIDALVYVADMDTYDLLYLNRRGRSLFGDFFGQKCYAIIQNFQNGPCPFCTNGVISDQLGSTGVYQWECQNTNNGRWYDCRDRAIHWSDGRLVRLEIATDITERKKAEEELFETKQRLSDLINFLPDATFAIDYQGRVIAWNRAIEEMTGIVADDIMGKGNYEYALPFYGERRPILIDLILMPDSEVERNYSAVRKEGDTLIAETRLAHPSGKNVYLWGKASFLKNVQGEIVGAIESIRDITERKIVEDNLTLKEFAIESSIDGIVITDLSGILTSVNAAFLRILGYDSALEVLGRSLFSFWQEDEVATRVATVIQENGSWSGELIGLRKDSTPVAMYLTINLIHDPSGKQAGMFGSCTDITSQKEMESKLHASEMRVQEKLNAILSQEGDIGSLDLGQIIDVTAVQHLMDDFFTVTRIGVAILDIAGNILVATGWQDICTKFHRIHPVSSEYCRQSDTILSLGVIPGTFKLYQCRNNMWDMATPIMIGGVHLGNLFLGQFFFDDEDIDLLKFREQAKKYGFDEEEYISALKRVPRWSRDTVNAVMQFYTRLIHLIAEVSFSTLRLARTVHEKNNLLLSIQESEEKFKNYVNNAPYGVLITDEKGHFLEVNPAACRITGYTSEALVQMQIRDVVFPHSFETEQIFFQQVVEKGKASCELVHKDKDGSLRYLSVEGIRISQTRFICFVQDITGRKQVEDALRKNEEKYRQLIEHANEAIVVVQEGMIKLVNPRGIELTGFQKEELLFMPFSTFIHPDDRVTVIERYKKRLKGEDVPSRYSFRLIGKDESTLWVEISAVTIEWEGSPATMNFLIDITDRKRAEDALQESNKKLRLLTGLTRHDIFNQLSAVQMLHDLALKEEEPAAIHSYISYAQEARDKIEAIIAFTRDYEYFGVESSGWQRIHAIIEAAKTEISEGTVILYNEIPDHLEVYADPIIRKVFTTLMDNAIRHGGCITYIRFYSEVRENTLIIICEDDGIGISDEEKKRIFHQGYGDNTGMGLFIAQEILAITGLSIRETGIMEDGARFEILVPPGKFRRGKVLND